MFTFKGPSLQSQLQSCSVFLLFASLVALLPMVSSSQAFLRSLPKLIDIFDSYNLLPHTLGRIARWCYSTGRNLDASSSNLSNASKCCTSFWYMCYGRSLFSLWCKNHAYDYPLTKVDLWCYFHRIYYRIFVHGQCSYCLPTNLLHYTTSNFTVPRTA